MKIEPIINDDDMKEIKKDIDYLLKKDSLSEMDFVESGGLGVRVENISEDRKTIIFSIYRDIGMITKKLR